MCQVNQHPRFLWIHSLAMHLATRDREAYRRTLREVDRSLGILRDEIGTDPLWILTSDHGEEFGDHGGFFHGFTLYDEVTRVPLLVAHPRLPAPLRWWCEVRPWGGSFTG